MWEERVFFGLSSLHSYSSVDFPFFPATKPKQDKKKIMKRRDRSKFGKFGSSFAFFPLEKRKKWTKCRRYFLFSSFFSWTLEYLFFPLSRHFPPCPLNLTASKHALANVHNQKRAKSLRVRVYSRANFTSRASRSGSLYLKKRAR